MAADGNLAMRQVAALQRFFCESVPGLGRPESLLWCWLLLQSGPDLTISVSLLDIAKALAWSESSVFRCMDVLVRRGLVLRRPRRKVGEINGYTLCPVGSVTGTPD